MKQKNKRVISYLLSLCFFFSTFVVLEPAAYASAAGEERTVSGNISLPDDELAVQDTYVAITARNNNGTPEFYEDDTFSDTTCMIPTGQNSAAYSVNVPNSVTGSAISIGYNINENYLQAGYYNTNGMVTSLRTASMLDVSGGSITDINLELLRCNTISGTISRPVGAGTEAPITVILDITDMGDPLNGKDDLNFGQSVTIPAGEMTAEYAVSVVAGNYRIRYYLFPQIDGYAMDGYYSDNGTTSAGGNAAIISVTDYNILGKDLTLLPGCSISGAVSLPDGDTAPAGGLLAIVAVWSDNGTEDGSDDFNTGIGVTIPEGGNTADYTFFAPKSVTGSAITVRYIIDPNVNYQQVGYYNANGMVVRQSDASKLDTSNGTITGINLTIMRGYTISGTVSRPVGASTEAPVTVDINAKDEGPDPYSWEDDLNYRQNITIPAGAMTADYVLPVAAGNYRIQYYMNQTIEGYISKGFYNDNGTTMNYDNATIFPVTDSNITGKNITLLSGKLITGTISLPDGDMAPAGGLLVDVIAWSDNGTEDWSDDLTCDMMVTIPEGGNNAAYSVTIPDDASRPVYKIRYYIFADTGYLPEGYYNTNGTVIRQDDAGMVDVSSGNSIGNNFTILRGYKISGTVSRPVGANTNEPVTIEINATDEGADPNNSNDDMNYMNEVTIPAGEMTIAYALTVAPGNYKIRYWMREPVEGYIRDGYLGDSGTTPISGSSAVVPVIDNNITGKNITLLPGKVITGTISLPEGDTAPAGGLLLDVVAWNDNGTEDGSDDFSGNMNVTIPEGKSTGTYFITVPDDASRLEYKVRYYIFEDTSYLGEGYYSNNGTVACDYNASMVDVSGNSTGINLMILKGLMISGTVSRPAGADTTAPIEVYISATDEGANPDYGDDDMNFGTNITIPAGEISADYTLTVAAGNYKIQYRMFQTTEGYLSQGYIIENGTSPFWSNAVATSVQNDIIKNISLLPGSTITGTISMPDGETAPAGGLELTVIVGSDGGTDTNSDDFDAFTWVNIPEGESTVSFALSILGSETRTYWLDVNTPSNSIYTAPDEIIFTANEGVYSAPINVVLNKSQLSGQLQGPNGETIEYGYVEIRKEDGSWFPGVSTNQTGKFTIGGLPDGQYLLRASKWDSDFTASKEVMITISQGKYIPIPENDPLTIRLTSPQITGTVLNAEGAPMNGGNVELRDQNDMWVANANVNFDGTYSFGGLSAGTYIIKAYPYWQSTDYTPSKDEVIVIKENETISYNISLTAPQIRGTVLDGDGNPASQGWVEIYNKITGMGMPGSNIIDGNYSLGGLSDGIYVLRAHPEPGTQFTASAESEITITDGKLSSGIIDFDFTKAQFEGTVSDPYGNSTEYGWIEIRKENGDWIPGSPVSRNGQFTVGGLDDGRYIIKAYPNGGVRYTPSLEEIITITGGIADPASINIQLTLPQAAGILVTPDGAPLLSGYIEIRKDNGEWVNCIGADYDGYFAIGGLPEGTYIIKAYPGNNYDYCASDEIEITILNDQLLEDIIIALNNPQITGTVLAPDGAAAQNAYVDIYSSDGRWVTGAPVNQNGLFSIGSLKDGIYEIKAYPDWRLDYCASDSGIITIQSGVYVGAPVVMQLNRPLITGTVKDPAGTVNVPFGWVEVKNYDTGEWLNGYGVNEFGRFSIGNLPNGTYTLRAIADQNSPYSNSEEMIIKVNNGIIYYENDAEITNLEMKLTTSRIIGKVVGPDGISQTSFGWVEAYAQDGTWIAGSSVNYNGEFRLGKLGPAGTYIIKAYPDSSGDYTASMDIAVVTDDDGNITYADSNSMKDGILTIKLSEVQFKGIVINTTYEPASFGWVEVQKATGDNSWDWINGYGLDWNGGFKIGGLADGTYRLKAYPDQSDNTVSASSYYKIVISGGAVISCDVLNAFDPTSNTITMKFSVPQLSGKIVGPNGEAVAYGWVEIRGQNDEYITGIGAGMNGEFAVSGLEPNQSYTIVAYPAMNSGFTQSEAISITTDVNGICSNTVTLQLTGIQVTGRVTTPDGQPTRQGWVEIYLNGQWVTSSGINENGVYKFGGLEDGHYTILAFAEPGTPYANSQMGSFEIAGGIMVNAAPLDLALTIPQTTGIVYLPGGITKAYGGWVEIGDANENWLLSVPIGNDGTFKLPAGLGNGNYTIQAFPNAGSAYGASDVAAFIIDGNPVTLTLFLK